MGPEAATYRLLRVPGLSEDALGRVLTAWRDGEGLLDRFWGQAAAVYQSAWGLSARAARFLQEADDEEEAAIAAAAVAAAKGAEVEILSLQDASYAPLAAVRALPPVLFTRGNQDLIWHAGVAIPHSRDASERALSWGAELAGVLADAGIGLVTGHNRDGYRRTAAAAKRAGAPVTLVLDRPLHASPSRGPCAEPVTTARLWDEQFRPERELVVSAVPPTARWLPSHARGRDALVIALADVLVAGDVRAGGIIAGLCSGAAASGRAVFRTPFCRAELDAPLLPLEIEAAAGVVRRAVSREREAEALVGANPACLQPGWLERRWAAEASAFVESLAVCGGHAVWIERRPLGSLHEPAIAAQGAGNLGPVLTVIQLPGLGESGAGEVVMLGRRSTEGDSGSGEQKALLLSPGEPVRDLNGFRAYLSRCLARAQEALRSPPR